MSVLAGGCMVGPNCVRPEVEQPLGFKSQPAGEAGAPIAPDWWRLYADPELDGLIATAQAENQTVRQAVARVDQARALARVAGSFLFPSISTDPNFSWTRTSANRASTITGKKVTQGVEVTNWQLPID